MALEKFSANDAHLLRFPGCSCGFLRAGRFNGTGMSCPVSISLSTRELSQAIPIYSHRHSPVAHLLFAGRVIHQQLLLSVVGPNSRPCSRAACCCCGSHSLRAGQQPFPSLPAEQKPGKAPPPARSHGPAAASTHESLLPLSLAARQSRKETCGMGQGTEGSEPG